MRSIRVLTGLMAVPMMLGLAVTGVAVAGDPIPDVDVTLKHRGLGSLTAGDITNEANIGDITTGDVTSSELVDEGDGPGLTKNYNSSRSNRSVAISSDGDGDVTTTETTNTLMHDEGPKLIGDEITAGDVTNSSVRKPGTSVDGEGAMTGDIANLTITEEGMPSKKSISKAVVGDDYSDSINILTEKPALEPPASVVSFGDGAVGPVNISELDASITGNIVKGHWPPDMSGTWEMRPDRSIHDNPVSGNTGITTTVISTGDFSTINTSTNFAVGTVSP